MADYKVWNDNVYPYKEKFKDELVVIQPKQFIVMNEDDAFQFKGTFCAPRLDADGAHKAEGFKMIRLEKVEGSEALDAPKFSDHVCMACNYKGDNETDLKEHTKAAHAELTNVVDEEAEEAIKTRAKKKTA